MNAVMVCPNQRAEFILCNPYRIGIVTTVKVVDIWQGVVRIEEQRAELGRVEDWNVEKEE